MNIELAGLPRLLAASLAVLCACSAPAFEKPQPPDMADLLRRYESPDGSFSPDDAEAVGMVVALLDEAVGDTDIVGRLTDLLGEVIEQVSDVPNLEPERGSEDELPLEFNVQGDGYAVLTRICPGWTSPSVVDPANGNAVLTATFSEEGLDPVIWGTVSACRYRFADTLIELTPSTERDAFRVYWDGAASRQTILEGALLSLALRADVSGDTLDLDVDVRLLGDGVVEYLLPTGDGSLVVRTTGDGTVAVRAVEGSFECDEASVCTRTGQGVGDAP